MTSRFQYLGPLAAGFVASLPSRTVGDERRTPVSQKHHSLIFSRHVLCEAVAANTSIASIPANINNLNSAVAAGSMVSSASEACANNTANNSTTTSAPSNTNNGTESDNPNGTVTNGTTTTGGTSSINTVTDKKNGSCSKKCKSKKSSNGAAEDAQPSLDEIWRLKDPAARTNADYYIATQKDWSRAWDNDWDGRHPVNRGQKASEDRATMRKAKKQVIRHVYLIRHGQYDLEGDAHGLTELGKHQAKKTGQKLRAMADGLKSDHYGEIKVKWKSINSSGLLRARETADIIAEEIGMNVNDYDALLNEGNPCIMHPGSGYDLDSSKLVKLGTDPPRIESAFRKHIHRNENWKRVKKDAVSEGFSPEGDTGSSATVEETEQQTVHQYEIIVCHMNVIRYFLCRALQMPPEAWLRFRGDNCGLTEIILYDDGRVSLGRFADQGHLTIEETTFH